MALRALASRSATSGVAVTAAAGRCASVAAAAPASAVVPAVQRRQHRRSSRGVASVVASAATRSAVSTDKAPGAVGPYSQAIKTTGAPLLFVSGQVALVPGTKELAAGGVEAQAEQCLKNLGEILREGGASFDSVVKTTVLLADMGDFAAVNGVYAKYFSRDPQPARACFAVKALPLGALVEIEATAVASG